MNPITVSALTTHIVALFESDMLLRDMWVTGEVSTWKRAASGHVYFSLKDSGSTINAVMWRGSAEAHGWLPRAGDQIVAHGYVGVYPERGAYQFYANQIQPAGRGQLYAQFEALKERLAAEGLFDDARKRMICERPTRIAVVTSADAAALRDVVRILGVRWPLVDVILFPTLVQGAEAPTQIERAIEAANHYHVAVAPIDTLILARGGGSIEDLWAFNDERVAYAVADSMLPVVVGVGHETDFTIADFVADYRAPTPTAAAVASVPDREDVLTQLGAVRAGLVQDAIARLSAEAHSLVQRNVRLARLHPQRRIDRRRQHLDERSERLHSAVRRALAQMVAARRAASMRLDALNPHNVLERGYSILQNSNRDVLTGPDQSMVGETLTVRSAQGDYVVVRN